MDQARSRKLGARKAYLKTYVQRLMRSRSTELTTSLLELRKALPEFNGEPGRRNSSESELTKLFDV